MTGKNTFLFDIAKINARKFGYCSLLTDSLLSCKKNDFLAKQHFLTIHHQIASPQSNCFVAAANQPL